MVSQQRIKLNVAENLQRLMSEKDLTQVQLAKKAAISQSLVSKSLTQRTVCSSWHLKNLADALGVSADCLLSDPPSLRDPIG